MWRVWISFSCSGGRVNIARAFEGERAGKGDGGCVQGCADLLRRYPRRDRRSPRRSGSGRFCGGVSLPCSVPECEDEVGMRDGVYS